MKPPIITVNDAETGQRAGKKLIADSSR